eukprot:8080430-Pyramimonas_sp.AAC.1
MVMVTLVFLTVLMTTTIMKMIAMVVVMVTTAIYSDDDGADDGGDWELWRFHAPLSGARAFRPLASAGPPGIYSPERCARSSRTGSVCTGTSRPRSRRIADPDQGGDEEEEKEEEE